MPDLYTPYDYNDGGDLLDPPVIQRHERDLIDAQNAGDVTQIEMVTEEYAEKRGELAEKHNDKVKERAAQDKALREASEREQSEARDANAEQQRVRKEREEADRLREQHEAGTGPFADKRTDQPTDRPDPAQRAAGERVDMERQAREAQQGSTTVRPDTTATQPQQGQQSPPFTPFPGES